MTELAQGANAPSILTDYEAATVRRAMRIIERKRLKDVPLLYYFEDYQKYLMLRFAGLTNEQHHVLYIDINRCLLEAEVSNQGNHKSVSYNLRQIAHKAISLGADAVVFAHNHPSDDPTPSEQDVYSLGYCENALAPMQIELLESYVVTSFGITSIKNYRKKQEELALARRRVEQERKRKERYERNKDSYARSAKKRAAAIARKKAEAAKLVGESV